jgi:hypothetical protein
MKDILGWECSEGCDCVEKGHIHFNDERAIARPNKPKPWWNLF